MKTSLKFALLAAICGASAFAADKPEVDCSKLSLSIKQEVTANRSLVLQIVEKAVLANQSCACEIVKAAIVAAEADNAMIASIVEVAAIAAPEQMRLVAQCAVAVAPDSLTDVQAVLAKLDPGTGRSDSSGKEVAEKGGMDKIPVKTETPDDILRRPFLERFERFQPIREDAEPATKNSMPYYEQ